MSLAALDQRVLYGRRDGAVGAYCLTRRCLLFERERAHSDAVLLVAPLSEGRLFVTHAQGEPVRVWRADDDDRGCVAAASLPIDSAAAPGKFGANCLFCVAALPAQRAALIGGDARGTLWLLQWSRDGGGGGGGARAVAQPHGTERVVGVHVEALAGDTQHVLVTSVARDGLFARTRVALRDDGRTAVLQSGRVLVGISSKVRLVPAQLLVEDGEARYVTALRNKAIVLIDLRNNTQVHLCRSTANALTQTCLLCVFYFLIVLPSCVKWMAS